MQAHYSHPNTLAEWGLSVAAASSLSEVEILRGARHLRQSHYRVASVEALHDLGDDALAVPFEQAHLQTYVVVMWDHNTHGLILSSKEPTLELAAAIAAAFGPPKVNPYYEERSRSRASR
jgi:hypothetical protein